VPGFPIRTSSDPRSVDNSPRHIAASHVLHRLLMPRHPPCALTHLQTQKTKEKTLTKQEHPDHIRIKTPLLARCSQPLSTNQTPHPTTKRGDNNPHKPAGAASGPNSVPAIMPPPTRKPGTREMLLFVAPSPHPLQARTPHGSHPTECGMSFVVLLRKEVIQPHLPVRLPCYDFVPIADPTFDSSPHKG
jgi:hypothetical protein